ncbi:hypothetical protein PTSG_10055 [Salpingoeca rosetta]|uniref:Uncharacterized protein n=1 Tax=Salpingoeca rosetta (strain ATCC 50818 / BSB-021) TaxID=946362 RepID=F2UPD4_SALR5|nr:uncharacterized protein PTSG_10055 [Salpingoeca rosetta]EGD79489.1 hypothetical protein PTSG_10055 [Salpingoeca rosetta]|eukprot:XP_004988970.1 hypothetical protein PTSG_10055 [Salpingoeca rosetta]
MSETKELLGFLDLDTREDVRSGALRIVLGLTASEQSKDFFKANPEFVDAIVTLVKDDDSAAVRRDAFCALTNLAEIEHCAHRMIEKGRAIEASKHALRLYDTYRKHDRAVNALIVQASCHLELSRPGEVVQGCLDHLRRWEMAEVEDQPEDHALLALLYAKVGRAFFELQKFDIAADTLQSALRICPHTSGYRGTLLQNLGAALNATGSFEEAVTFHKQALKEFVQSPQAISEHLANIRDNLGFAEGMTGDLNAASMSLERAHVLWLEAGLPSMAVLSLERLGGVLEHFNLPQRALVHYQRAIGCAASNGLEEDRTRVEEKVQAIWDALTDAEHKRMYGNAAAIMAAEAEAAVAVTHTGTDTPAQAPTSHQQNQQQQQQQQGAFDRRAEQPAAMSSYGNTGSDGDEDDGVGVGGDGRGGGGGGDEDGGVGDRRQLASFGPSRSSGDTIMLGVPDDEEEDQDRYNGQGGDWIPFTDNGQWHRQQQHGRGVNEASYLAPTPAGFGHGDPSYAEIPTLSETQLEHVPPATPSVSRGALQQASVVAAPSTDRNGTTNTSRVANTGSTGRRSGRRREDVRGRGSARGSGRSRPHSKGEGPDASSRACTIM